VSRMKYYYTYLTPCHEDTLSFVPGSTYLVNNDLEILKAQAGARTLLIEENCVGSCEPDS
jgi:hypothetical protein